MCATRGGLAVLGFFKVGEEEEEESRRDTRGGAIRHGRKQTKEKEVDATR